MRQVDKRPNVLVTGGAGYVGSHVAKALAQAGFTPICFDNLSRGFANAVKWGPLINSDVLDKSALGAALADYSPVGVIHLAGLTYVNESIKSPLNYFHHNVGGSQSLLSAMLAAGLSNLVFSSTCSIYGDAGSSAIDETCPPRPLNPYAQSKWMVEQILDAVGNAHGIRSIRLRYFNAAGADPEGEIGENHEPETHLIPLVLQTAIGQRRHIEVYGDDYPTPDGTAIRDYVHVTDLADAHVAALRHLLEGGESLTVNLANGGGYSVREVIDVANSVTGKTINVLTAPRRHGDQPKLIGDASIARDTLLWRPRFMDLEMQITHAWNWVQKIKV